MKGIFGGVISLVLSVILIATVVVPTVKDQNTSGWTTAETTVFGLVSLMSIFGLAYGAGSIFGLL